MTPKLALVCISLTVAGIIILYLCWRFYRMKSSEALAQFYADLDKEVTEQINNTVQNEVASLNESIRELEEMARANCAKMVVKVADIETTIEGTRHKQLDKLITLVANKLSVMLVGMAGTGKTHAAQQVAEALGREFYAMSVGAQTSKSDILGYMHAGGSYVDTMFRRAYEFGGVFLMDEIDAGNANVLIQINAAIANQYCAFPDQMVKRHDDFVFIGSANTYGTGANRQYVGRNQLDAATLDRFTILEWNIDEKLEMALAGDDTQAMKWCRAMRELRKYVTDEGMRVLVTPRATQRGAVMLATGIPQSEVAELAIVGMFPNDKKDRVRSLISDSMSRSMKGKDSSGESASLTQARKTTAEALRQYETKNRKTPVREVDAMTGKTRYRYV